MNNAVPPGTESAPSPQTAKPMSPWRAAMAAMVGSVLEYYDFFVYGPLAAIALGAIFFDDSIDPAFATMLSLLTFAAGFIARPVGGIVIGHFGDRLGRKSMLILTFMIMGVATVLMGLLPTYESIGVAAPILLVLLRIAQGFGIGGEWGGAALLAVESAPPEKKNFFGSLVQAGAPIGVILSSGTIALVTALTTREELLAWGWRIPFLASAVLVVFGMWLRTSISETPEFVAAQKKMEEQQKLKQKKQLPILHAITRFPGRILAMIGTHISDTTLGFVNGVFVIGFATGVLQMEASIVLLTNMASAAANFICTPIAGRLADRFGPRRVLGPATIFLGIWAFPAFWLIETRSVIALFFVMVVGGMIVGTLFSPQASLFSRALPAEVRYTGMSIGFQIATVVGGGFGPVLAQWLVATHDGSTTLVSLYIIVVAAIAFISVLYLTKKSNRVDDLDHVHVGGNA